MKLLDILRGITLNPVLTAFARGLAEALAFVALYSVGDFVAANGLPDGLGQWTPIALVAIRTLEGVIDRIDPAKQRQRDVVETSTAPGYTM